MIAGEVCDVEGDQMRPTVRLGTIWGIEVGLHYSWFLIAILVTASLGTQFTLFNPTWSATTVWSAAFATGLLFFLAIILHELSHAAVAKARGLPVRSITLFALGGVAQIEREAADARTEFWMGIVGPIASLVLGGLCLLGALVLGWSMTLTPADPVVAVLMWLGVINLTLAVFNLIPGFPLDGGRVLRAVLWWLTNDLRKATMIASFVGQIVAFGFIVFGILRFVRGAGFGGLWLAFIGWFLLDAARASREQTEVMESLKGLQVGEIMAEDFPTISGRENLQTFVDEYLLTTGYRYFFVRDHEQLIGLITPHEIKSVPRNHWLFTTIDQVMVPLERLHSVEPQTLLTTALEAMGKDDVNQMPVVRAGRLTGVISRKQILRILQTRADLQV